MARTKQITIGEASFVARGLNLGEYESLIEELELLGAGTSRQRLAANRAIVLSAWRQTDPTKTEADVLALVAPPIALVNAAAAILDLSALKKDDAPGEDKAAPEPAPVAA